jgi:ABC-type uncharacterized transport system ATPase subunit
MVGYVGPNRPGKSTTIKMVMGTPVPTSVTVEVDGLIPHRDRKRKGRIMCDGLSKTSTGVSHLSEC